MNTSLSSSNSFITEDICIKDFDFQAIDRYELTSSLNSGELQAQDYRDFSGPQEFSEWAESNLSEEELYETPMMNSVYCYPSFVTFHESDRYKVAPSTTLFFDRDLDSWAVGMTGGGMDLTPHLLETFIALGSGIPTNIAAAATAKYPAYIEPEKHRMNCEMLANAFERKSIQFINKAKELSHQSNVTHLCL